MMQAAHSRNISMESEGSYKDPTFSNRQKQTLKFSQFFPTKPTPTVAINPTTYARWERHCPPEAIQAQLLKLQGLNISNLNIDYELKNRQIADHENEELTRMRKLANPYMIEQPESFHSNTSWAESRPDLMKVSHNKLH